MPTVARVTEPTVAPLALPGARNNAQLSPDFAAGVTRGLDKIGAVAGQIAEQEQAKADTAAVLEARRKLSDWERTWFDPNNPQGVYAKRGRDALGLVDAVAPDFERVATELQGSLRSPRAQQAFATFAAAQRESVLDRVNGYAVKEHDGYVAAEFKASVANSIETAARAALDGRWDDQGREVKLGLQSLRAQAVALGEPTEATQVKEREYLSAVHGTAVNAMLAQGKVGDAMAYFDANAEDLSPSAAGEIQARMRPLLIDATANAILDGMDTGQVTPAGIGADAPKDAVWDALLNQESGRRQHRADGSVVRSSAGAVGIAQVMPGTGPVAAKYAGLPWDAQRLVTDAAYNEALGRAYFEAQLTAFGSAPLALAAYNGGPGRVQKWLRPRAQGGLGDPRKGEVALADWVASIPIKETREYVQKITARAGGSLQAPASGDPAKPAPTAPTSLEGQLAAVRGVADPTLRAQLESGIRQRHAVREQDRTDRERQAKQAIWGVVESMDPRGNLAQALGPDQYAFAAQHGLLSTFEARLRERIGGQDPVTPPETLSSLRRIFYDAQRGSAIAQAEVRRMDLHSIRMSAKDRQEFEQVQLALLKPDSAKASEWATESEILSAKRAALGLSGAKHDLAWGAFEQEYLAQKRALGAQPTPDQVQAIVDRLTQPFVRKTFFGDGASVPAFRATEADVGDIPAPEAAKLRASFRAAGIDNPTPSQMMRAYLSLPGKTP